MNHLRAIIIAVLVFIFSMTAAAPVMAQVILPYTTDLLVYDKNTALDVGSVTLDVNGAIIFQIDEAVTDLRLAETRVYIGDKPPVKIRPEDFPYINEGLGGVSRDVINIDVFAADLNGDSIVYIAAYAVLTNPTIVTYSSKKPQISTETAVAKGENSKTNGKNRINYFSLYITG
jgi:hypothetical protein